MIRHRPTSNPRRAPVKLRKAPMRFVFYKPDMDTVLTGLILGCRQNSLLMQVKGKAPRRLLADPGTACIECGGSGQVQLTNFDHHDQTLPLPPACVQAFESRVRIAPALERLCDYVAWVDVGNGQTRARSKGGELGLSGLFSGMRLSVPGVLAQFRAGLLLFRLVLDHAIDPWGPMPDFAVWRAYRRAKTLQIDSLNSAVKNAEYFTTRTGVRGGYLFSSIPGVHGALRRKGCSVTIAHGLSMTARGEICTISATHPPAASLLPRFSAIESGWGGPSHGTVIGSPPRGTRLRRGEIIELALEEL